MAQQIKALFEQIKKTGDTCVFFYARAKKEKKGYIWIIFATILTLSLAPFVNIVLPKYIIDFLINDTGIDQVIICVLLVIFGNLFFELCRGCLDEARTKAEDWFARVFEMMISKKAMEMQFVNTEKEESIEAEKRAEIGMSWYSGGIKGISDCIVNIFSSVITFIGVAYIITRFSFSLILISIISVIVNTFVTAKVNAAQQEVFEKTPGINKFYSYIYQQMLSREYAKELRLYSGTKLVEEKAMNNAIELNKMDNQCAKTQFGWSIVGALCSALTYGVSYCWLGILVLRGEMSIADFVMGIAAIETFTNGCLNVLITNFQLLFMKANFMSAFITFMKINDAEELGKKAVLEKNKCEIEFKNVYFKYPGATEYVFEDLNIKISNQEKISIVGLNGAGKTTFVKLLCRLYDVDSGKILVNGIDINEYKYEEYIEMLSVVFQDFKLFSYSIDDNISIGCEKKDTILMKVCEMCGIKGWVSSLKEKGKTLLYKDYDNVGVEPSGGQAQKIALARAVYRNSPLIILDEPTAALDPIAEYEVYNSFNSLVGNKTCIYISHRLSSCKFCDKIAVFANKKVAEYGNHQELLALKGIYADLFATQSEWYEGCEDMIS